MANTLFDHGTEYHFYGADVNFTQTRATMRQTELDKTKPSKLELLQEDYRSRLLHEREQKANALFEQKVRANLLPKQGSVREFFLNRRMLADSATRPGVSNGVNLPPITSNARYKGKQTDQKNLVEKQLVSKRKTKQRVEATAFLKDMEKDDSNLSDLGKLREKYRKFKTEKHQGFTVENTAEKSLSPSLSTAYDLDGVNKDAKNDSLNKTRRVKSRELCRRVRKPSHETNKDKSTKINGEELESPSHENSNTKGRGVKSREMYKRSRKPSDEHDNERTTKTSTHLNMNTHKNTNENTNSENLTSSFTEYEVSKNLVKIKELVNRRKTQELITRSRTTKRRTESDCPTPRKTSQSFDEMCKAETVLRETISKERKKLLALQERRKQKDLEKRNRFEQKSYKETGRKQSQPIEADQNARLHPQYETKNSINSSRNANQQMQTKKTKTTQSTEINSNQENNSISAEAMIDLVTCSNCGRSFMKERVKKHEKACKKASSRIKRPFDAKRKRAEGTDMEKYIIMGKDTTDDSAYKEKKRNWRRTHENFIQSIRSARRQEPQPVTRMSNPDYIECSYCRRKFKPTVAERHIPRCKDIKARPRPPRR